jgi:two-component system OmpR family response regulator
LRFLIVEKDEALNQIIEKVLSDNNYKTDSVLSVNDASYFTEIRKYDLILLDWNLGKKDIIDFIENTRAEHPITKIVVISDDTSIETEIKALKFGADDYIKKPINFDLLIARIESKIRFGNFKKIKVKDLEIFPDEEKVIYQNSEIELKGKPFEVLMHLVKHQNQIISKEQLLDAIWEEPEMVTPNVIEVAINQIRQKIDKHINVQTIETVRRRGYKFCYPPKNS